MPSKISVLVVDDDADIRETMSDVLGLEGYSVATADGAREAVALCAKQHFDFALLDMYMPEMNGIETLREIKRVDPKLRAIMITGHDVGILVNEAMDAGAEAVFRKPLDVTSFLPLLMISEEG